jgi:hypothetical protein
MNSFEDFLSECLDVEVVGEPDSVDLHDIPVRDSINFALLDITDTTHDPRLAWDQIHVTLGDAGYPIPETSEYPETSEADGEIIVGLIAPGGEPEPCALYFAWSDGEVFAEVVTENELEEIEHEDVETV